MEDIKAVSNSQRKKGEAKEIKGVAYDYRTVGCLTLDPSWRMLTHSNK